MSIRTIGAFTAGALLASALTFTGMQSWQAGAAPGDNDTTFVPVPPCRLFDTRPGADNVGIRIAPIGPGETFPTQVTGSNGECIGIPTDATAVAFNVTTVSPTAASFLTLFPGDLTTPPKASNLNWTAGQPPTPNKVDVKLGADGKVKVFNNAGTVDVIADIVGYYTPSSLQAIQAQLDVLQAETDALNDRISDQRSTTQTVNGADRTITSAWTNVIQVSAPISRTGRVLVFASGTAFEDTAGHDVQCVITDTPDSVVSNRGMIWEASGATSGSSNGQGDAGVLAGTRSFSVTGGTFGTFALMCRNTVDGGTSQVWDPSMTVLFVRS